MPASVATKNAALSILEYALDDAIASPMDGLERLRADVQELDERRVKLVCRIAEREQQIVEIRAAVARLR